MRPFKVYTMRRRSCLPLVLLENSSTHWPTMVILKNPLCHSVLYTFSFPQSRRQSSCYRCLSWELLKRWRLFLFVCLFVCLFVFRDRVSLYSPGCPGTHFVDQAGLELKNLPASASRVLGLKARATTPGSTIHSYTFTYFVYMYVWVCMLWELVLCTMWVPRDKLRSPVWCAESSHQPYNIALVVFAYNNVLWSNTGPSGCF